MENYIVRAEDCLPRYGARTVINRIVMLTPDDFHEEVCSYVEPGPLSGPFREGLHTTTNAGGLVAGRISESGGQRTRSSLLRASLARRASGWH